MKNKWILGFAFQACISSQIFAAPQAGKYFDRAIFVIFENTNYLSAINQPFFKRLADNGAHFSNFMSITHPSQGNYVALSSGALNGVTGDSEYNLDADNIVDLLEAKGLKWKIYAEGYPGNCFTGTSSGNYARKHNPFISFLNIQRDPKRCANIVSADQFDRDALNNSLPEYVFYIPDKRNDGHDTGVAFADNWYAKRFLPYLNDKKFMDNTVLISTFDESGFSIRNQIYTSIVGPNVQSGVIGDAFNLYSLLTLIEDNWNLGNLGKQDVTANPIQNIWKTAH
ncbi:MAG: alkaline phosphatase family protein [Bdellovibrionota bacterium]